MKVRKGFIATLVSAAVMLGAAPTAMAGDTPCVGVLTGPHDNVVVPRGATCNLLGAQVQGNVKNFGNLLVFAPTRINGSLQSEPGHGFTQIFGAGVTIRENVQIKGATAGIAHGYLAGTVIGKDFRWEENRGFLVANGATIGGNAQAWKNTGGGSFTGNTIRGDLQCKENAPPITEAGNVVGGNRQCPDPGDT